MARKFTKIITLIIILSMVFSMNTFATEKDEIYSRQIIGKIEVTTKGESTEIPIIFVSEEEMNRLVESGRRITRDNWVTDFVAFTVTRDPNNSNKANIVLLNVGFVLDVVDSVSGSVVFYNSRGQAIVNHKVDEKNLVYGVARTDTVAATGFVSISYSITVTDGGVGTLNTGSLNIP